MHIAPRGEEASAIYHLLMLVTYKYGVFQGSRLDSAMKELGSPLPDVVFTAVVDGFLCRIQATLTKLFQQVRFGDIISGAIKYKSQEPASAVKWRM